MSNLPPGLEEFGAQLERAAERDVAERRRARRRPRLLRGVGLPVAAALAAAAVTAGAVRIADRGGPPIPAETSGGITGLQAPKDPAVVVSSAVANPSGGPPWVLRVFTNTEGHDCFQLGRLRDGIFGQVQGERFRKLPASSIGTCSDGTRRRAMIAVTRRGSMNLMIVYGLAIDREPVTIRYRGTERRVMPAGLGAFVSVFTGADPDELVVVRTRVNGRIDERRVPDE